MAAAAASAAAAGTPSRLPAAIALALSELHARPKAGPFMTVTSSILDWIAASVTPSRRRRSLFALVKR